MYVDASACTTVQLNYIYCTLKVYQLKRTETCQLKLLKSETYHKIDSREWLRDRAAILAKVTKVITFHPCIYIVQCTRVIHLVELWGFLIIINVYSSKNIVCACIFLLTINSIYNYFCFSK